MNASTSQAISNGGQQPAAMSPLEEVLAELEAELCMIPLKRDEKVEWGKVEEVSSGLYRTRLPTVGDVGSEWDDFEWFQKRGLRITDFRLAKVDFQSSRCSVGRFQTTYCKLDDPTAKVTLPPRGSDGGYRMWTLDLSPEEHISDVWTYSRVFSGNETKVCCPYTHQSLPEDGRVINFVRFKTNFDRCVGTMPCHYILIGLGHEFSCIAGKAFSVAGFWGRSGKSLTKLGVYLKVASPDSDPNRFRRAARELLLAHSRHEATLRKVGVESGCELGALPRAVVLQIVEKLKDEEEAEHSGRYKLRSPFSWLDSKFVLDAIIHEWVGSTRTGSEATLLRRRIP